jgi:phosphoribosyl 1,2-cyclic phosphate phosphodiesterase
MRALQEERTRSAFLLSGRETLLLDCGPDIRRQLADWPIDRLDAILISHEHTDHYFGLDDLLAFRRRLPREKWRPIPTYATRASWTSIKKAFGYLLDSLLEPRIANPGERLAGLATEVYPFKTFHGESAPGSVRKSSQTGVHFGLFRFAEGGTPGKGPGYFNPAMPLA